MLSFAWGFMHSVQHAGSLEHDIRLVCRLNLRCPLYRDGILIFVQTAG